MKIVLGLFSLLLLSLLFAGCVQAPTPDEEFKEALKETDEFQELVGFIEGTGTSADDLDAEALSGMYADLLELSDIVSKDNVTELEDKELLADLELDADLLS